jgi:hypothetical protein
MTERATKRTRRSFNRALLLGGAGLLVSGACARRATSSQGSPGEQIAGALPRRAGEGIEAVLEGGRLRLSYQLAPAVAESLKQSWASVTLVVAIDSLTQTPVCRPLAAGRSLEWREPAPSEGEVRWEATVEPRELLGLGGASGLWFLHASVLQHRSGVLALQLAAPAR